MLQVMAENHFGRKPFRAWIGLEPMGVAVPLPPAVLFFENKHPLGEKGVFWGGKGGLGPQTQGRRCAVASGGFIF